MIGFDSFSVSNINNQLNNMKRLYEFNEKKENGLINKESATSTKNTEMTHFEFQMENNKEAAKLQSLYTKVISGADLTSEELDYLKSKSPEIYEDALAAKQSRDQYGKKIKEAKSKEDVEKVHDSALQEFSAKAKAISDNGNIPKAKNCEILRNSCRNHTNRKRYNRQEGVVGIMEYCIMRRLVSSENIFILLKASTFDSSFCLYFYGKKVFSCWIKKSA